MTNATPTSVYRYYDRGNLLLYVGITSRGTRRQQEHNHDKDWWGFVSRQEVEHYSTRPQAIEREKQLIRKFRPPFNTQHNPDHAALRELYLATGDTIKVPEAIDPHAPSPAQLFHSVGGKVPLHQIQTGNVAQFAFPEHMRPLLASRVQREADVLLLAPKKRGILTSIQPFSLPPTLVFVNKRGGIPLLKNVHLHLKVVGGKQFAVRVHEARGEVA